MTEFWVSQKRHWCEYCKVWLNDTISARSTHENGVKHQENVARKLREMRQKGDAEKKEQELLKQSWSSIEAKAKAQYEKDIQAGHVQVPGQQPQQPGFGGKHRQDQAAQRAAAEDAADKAIKASAEAEYRLTGGALSKWEPDAGSGYLYNAALRYYYDKNTGWYYGGDPPSWTPNPPIPEVAKFSQYYQQPDAEEAANPPPLSHAKGLGTTMGSGVNVRGAAASAAPQGPAPSSAAPASQAPEPAPAEGRRTVQVKAPSHPMQSIGGYQFHHLGGKVGAARGLGEQSKQQGKAPAKRKAEGAGSGGSKVSKEEAEALARREAARARVERRTMGQFGLI